MSFDPKTKERGKGIKDNYFPEIGKALHIL